MQKVKKKARKKVNYKRKGDLERVKGYLLLESFFGFINADFTKENSMTRPRKRAIRKIVYKRAVQIVSDQEKLEAFYDHIEAERKRIESEEE